MSVYPKSLAYVCTKLSSYARNSVKVYPVNLSQTVPSSAQVAILLPSNTIIDLDSLALNGTWSLTNATNGAKGNMPASIESIIDASWLEIGGSVVGAGTPYQNVLFKTLMDFQGQDAASRRTPLNHHQTLSTVMGSATAAGSALGLAADLYTVAQATGVPFQISNWVGNAIGGLRPRYLDTSIMPDGVRLIIRLAGPQIIYANDTTTPWDYSLGNIYVTCDCISIQDGVYSDLIAKRLEAGPIEMPFQNWFSFLGSSGGTNPTTRFGISTGSLDLLMGTFLPSGYTTVGAADTNIGSSAFFKRGVTSTPEYTGATNRMYYTINNVQMPAYQMSIPDAYRQTLIAMGLNQEMVMQSVDLARDYTSGGSIQPRDVYALNQFATKYFLNAIRLNHPDEDEATRQSGVDMRGTNGLVQWTFNGAASGDLPLVFAKCTSKLIIGQGRQCIYEA